MDGGVHARPVCGLCEKLLIHTVLQTVWNTTWGGREGVHVTQFPAKIGTEFKRHYGAQQLHFSLRLSGD